MLVKYHAMYPVTACSSPVQDQEGTPKPFSRIPIRSAMNQLPAVPFLVPSILEALQTSPEYRDITSVIPGEADLYCAKSVKDAGGIVLTSDSDLLAHDLGPLGAVVFFGDIEMKDGDSLWAPIYQPATISGRLDLHGPRGLQALAFEMFLDNHGSLPVLVKKANHEHSIKLFQTRFEDFQREYVSLAASPLNTAIMPQIRTVLQSLDPRISEFVLQFPFIADIAAQPPYPGAHSSPHIFLPFSYDCPIRTTAWEPSRGVRQLAYGLINLVAPEKEQISTTFEHIRQETESGGRELQVPGSDQLVRLCASLVNLFKDTIAKFPSISALDLWTTMAVVQDIQFSHHNSKANLGQIVKQQVLQSKEKLHESLTWEILHYHAQLQSSLYSFRILKQILSVLLTYSTSENLPVVMSRLQETLAGLPPISEVQDLGSAISTVKFIRNMDMMKGAQEILGITIPEISSKPKMTRREVKRNRKADKRNKKPTRDNQTSNNPFELLGSE
ncbi:hypothetical protein GLAREA_11534 [Glarea lozoyensis ATCC 20868]|uniref:Asteroid domain-containing protein n=1 Tax=Glarea lozoyensis (strain ATCC 20868 / MF5171) TaxID=1116229 RepID=S3DE69_GLAL2|nr:uncharacterized protein GLAREA_11534 [Glarea lozoyensis ATCC 20868]EPE24953.1 hypothetical protein GLAREA_11534 [Glarea lozoyensis ATCC 20868]